MHVHCKQMSIHVKFFGSKQPYDCTHLAMYVFACTDLTIDYICFYNNQPYSVFTYNMSIPHYN